MNGRVKGDEEGEWTYTEGRGESVIDYVLESMEVKERIERMEIGDSIDSEHHPLVLCIKARKEEIVRKETGGRRMNRRVWSMKDREEIREALREVEESAKGMEEAWMEIRKQIQGILEVGCRSEQKRTNSGWSDGECEKGDEKGAKEIEEREEEGRAYREKKAKYKNMLETKKERRAKDGRGRYST